MTPHGLPILDPHSVSDSQLEMCVMSSKEQATITAETLVSDYSCSWEISDHFSKLHVLVCGFCHSVFHVIDQFRSHTTFCMGTQEQSTLPDTTVRGLALVLWTNSVLRLLRERLGEVLQQRSLIRRIENKWFTLPAKIKLGWEKAAQILKDISDVHDHVFKEDKPLRRDKHEQNEKHENSLLEMDIEEQRKVTKEMNDIGNFADMEKKQMKRMPTYHNYRDKKGRWESKNKEKNSENTNFRCDICNFTAVTEWKLRRHGMTRKHMETIEKSKTNIDHDKICANETETSSHSPLTNLRIPKAKGDMKKKEDIEEDFENKALEINQKKYLIDNQEMDSDAPITEGARENQEDGAIDENAVHKQIQDESLIHKDTTELTQDREQFET